MHCPQCGLQQTSGEARFCRACGFSLNELKELLVPEARNTKVDKTRSRRVETAFQQGLLLMLASLFLAIVLTLLHDIHLIPQIYVKIVAGIFVVAGLARMFSPYFWGEDARRVLFSSASPSRDAQVETSAYPHALPASHSIPVVDLNPRRVDTAEMAQPPSVTEHTTKLLDNPRERN